MTRKIVAFLIFAILGFMPCVANRIGLRSAFSSDPSISDTIQLRKELVELKKLVAKGKYKEAINHANLIEESARELDYFRGLAYVNKQRAKIEVAKGSPIVIPLQYYEKAKNFYKQINDARQLAKVCNAQHMLEKKKGSPERSANYLLESKLYYEQLNDTLGVSGVYNNLGNLYIRLKDFKASQESYIKAIALRKKIKKTKGIGIAINNLGLAYLEDNQPDIAKQKIREALAMNKKAKIFKTVAHSYAILVRITFHQKEFETAKKYCDTALHYADISKYTFMTSLLKQRKGLIYMHLKQYEKAEALLRETRTIFQRKKNVEHILNNYEFSAKLDSARGDLKSAFTWQKRYQRLSDELQNEITTDKIAKVEARFAAELENLKKLEEQKEKEETIKSKLYQYRVTTFITLGTLATILIFLVLIVRNRKERKALITKLDKSNQIKNKLFSMISHDLKNEIFSLESSLNLIKDNMLSPEEFTTIIPLLSDHTHQTSILLNNLLNWSKSQLNVLKAKPTVFDVNELIKEKFLFFQSKAAKKNIQLINKLPITYVYADKDMIGIIAQNLLANAIKFCNEGDSVLVEAVEKGNRYEICFVDTGVGMSTDTIGKLFQEETFTTVGTQNELGTGLGLKICKDLIVLNQGTIQVHSVLGKGSTFCVSLPKACSSKNEYAN